MKGSCDVSHERDVWSSSEVFITGLTWTHWSQMPTTVSLNLPVSEQSSTMKRWKLELVKKSCYNWMFQCEIALVLCVCEYVLYTLSAGQHVQTPVCVCV